MFSPGKKRKLSGDEESKPDVDTESCTEDTKPETKHDAKPNIPTIKDAPGVWTPEKREAFIDALLLAGYKAVNVTELASSLGLKRQQLVNQLAPSRKGSIREKVLAAARGDDGKGKGEEWMVKGEK